MTEERIEVDTDQLRSAAASLSDLGRRLGRAAPSVPGHTGPSRSDPPSGSDDPSAGPGEPSDAGHGTSPDGSPDPAALLGEAGLDGWSCGSILSRLSSDWDTAVSGLVDEYADHAEQLRAAAERYDDAERIIEQALREADGC